MLCLKTFQLLLLLPDKDLPADKGAKLFLRYAVSSTAYLDRVLVVCHFQQI
jgi:hypothetical protein